MASQWLAQVAAMRQAISELKLDLPRDNEQGYGHDIVVDNQDVTDRHPESIWDISSNSEEDDYSSTTSNSREDTRQELGGGVLNYNVDWLKRQCTAITKRKLGLDAGDLQEQLSALLGSDAQGGLYVAFRIFKLC